AATFSYVEGGGGHALPSIGNLHILIVFAEFPDDNYQPSNSRWIKGQAPANMNGWIDQTWSASPTQGSLTHYFNEMSDNRFHVTGDVVHTMAPHTREWYVANIPSLRSRRFEIQKDIIENLDATINFADYDNCDVNGFYNIDQNSNDNIVDMIIFVWRNITNDSSSPNYKSELNFTHNFGDLGNWAGSIMVDNGATKINTGWGMRGNEPGGSGVTVNGYLDQDPFKMAIHEFAHYLLGHNDMHNGFGWWGMLSDWGTKTYVANSFERQQLGWFGANDLVTIDASGSNVQTITQNLSDYVTTNKAVKVIVNSSTKEYFYLENHQQLSYWETHTPFSSNPNVTDGQVEPGLYVIRQNGLTCRNLGGGGTAKRQCIPADGRWDWVVNQSAPNPWGAGYLPVYKKLDADKTNGYHDLQRVPHNFPGLASPQAIHLLELYGNPHQHIPHNGDGNDAFKMGYNQTFTKWSNPNNQRQSGAVSNFGFHINSKSGTNYNLTIYVNNEIDAAPSKPLNLKAISSTDNHPKISWTLNDETDITRYEIYREVDNSGDWFKIGQVASNVNVYSDLSAEFTKPIWANKLKYAVKAVDGSNKKSVKSDYVSIRAKVEHMPYSMQNEKIVMSSDNKPENDISSYPNPFNPSTKISYSLKKKTNVKIVVYNVLGQIVDTLENGIKDQGKHIVLFDGSRLSSGVYYCSIQSEEYSKTIKLILNK
ncbi:MAG: T9SS type A sorting domain-containing protein, partial [Rhodothermaceae bacterium]